MASRKRQPIGTKLLSKNAMTLRTAREGRNRQSQKPKTLRPSRAVLRSETSLCSDCIYNQIRVKNKT